MNSTDNLVNGHANGKTVVDHASFANDAFHEQHHNGNVPIIGAKMENGFSAKATIAESEAFGQEEDDFYDPLREEVPDNERTNYAQTLMNLMNGIIGSGVLSMPIAFLNGGWLVALIVTPIIGLISCYCIHLLLSVNVSLMQRTTKASPYDYHEVRHKQCILFNARVLKSKNLVKRNAKL